jgi:beta-1,4-mannooligosaccharide/beta-1,4-mannosyl-N-acetylglucosamine phosphorylase
MFHRVRNNPIISPKNIVSSNPVMIDVSSVFNPGAIKFDGKTILLMRVQNRGRETLLVKAESNDGTKFAIENTPIEISGLDRTSETIFHIYDPRVTCLDGIFYIMVAVDVVGKCMLGIIQTQDFNSFEFLGFTGNKDNRNGVLFSERINGKYARLDRPNIKELESGTTTGSAIWYSESDDLINWPVTRLVMEGRLHFWDENIGAGPPPVKTEKGWLLIYHGIAMHYQPIYQAGVVLLDLNEPWRVISRGRYNVLEPREMWEMVGQVPNVVFPTGIIVESYDENGFANNSSEVKLYYGAADTHIGLATSTIQSLIDACFS